MNKPTQTKSQEYIFINILTNVKEELDNIESLINSLKNYNQDLFNYSIDILDNVKKEIDNNILILKKKLYFNTDNKKEKIFNSLKKKYELSHESISSIYNNNYLINIKKSLEKIDGRLDIIFDYEFDPPNINSFENLSKIKLNFSTYSKNFYGSFDSFYSNEQESDKRILKCFSCRQNAEYFCKHCNKCVCEECYIIQKKQSNIHNFELINDIKTEKENNKNLFLKSICNIIKKILIMINSILVKDNMILIKKEITNKENSSSSKYIFEKIKYPYLNDIDNFNFDSVIDFLKNLNQLFVNLNLTSLNVNEFQISKMEKNLINIINNIIEDKAYENYKYNLKIIEENFFSDDDISIINE